MKNLKELFVPYELAVKLKEKGFNEDCFGYYSGDNPYGELVDKLNIIKCKQLESVDDLAGRCLAPTYQQAHNWLMINRKLFIEISNGIMGYNWHINRVDVNGSLSYNKNLPFSEYYDCYNKAINEALKLI